MRNASPSSQHEFGAFTKKSSALEIELSPAAERKEGRGAPLTFDLEFFPCNAQRANVKILHSRGHGAPVHPSSTAYAIISAHTNLNMPYVEAQKVGRN